MKIILICFLVSCFSLLNGQQRNYQNVQYGNDTQQTMDVYFPSITTNKVILLIHGGGWSAGDKNSMNGFVYVLQRDAPDKIIVNMNYRLGTSKSPGYPKQLEDIRLVINFTKTAIPLATFALVGASAGAHLAMLYAYKVDTRKDVKIVVDVVGPTDLTDPEYTDNKFYSAINLVGPCYYKEDPKCPNLYQETSPVKYVTKNSPTTIGFYGDNDILIPNTQMSTLKKKLNEFGVRSNFTVYPGGHMDWDVVYLEDMVRQIKNCLQKYW